MATSRYRVWQMHRDKLPEPPIRWRLVQVRGRSLGVDWDNQAGRRNCTPQQLSLVRAKLYEAAKEGDKANLNRGDRLPGASK